MAQGLGKTSDDTGETKAPNGNSAVRVGNRAWTRIASEYTSTYGKVLDVANPVTSIQPTRAVVEPEGWSGAKGEISKSLSNVNSKNRGIGSGQQPNSHACGFSHPSSKFSLPAPFSSSQVRTVTGSRYAL